MKEKRKAIRTILAIIIFTVLFIYFVYHTHVITGLLSRIINLIFPFLLGCAIAFVINIPMRGIENSLFKNPEGKLYKSKRAISMALAYIVMLVILVLVMFVVVPEIAETVKAVKDKTPGFVKSVQEWAQKNISQYTELVDAISKFEVDFEAIGSIFKKNGTTILSTTVNIFSSIINIVVNVSIGFVFSLYILSQKETLGRQTKMVLYACCKENVADEFMVFGKIANTTFSKFFTCQFREGIIIGAMFALSMAIFRMPFPITIGVLIGFTALIPVFGAFFGLFIGCFMILVDTPGMLIWFVVLFFTLQFIENNFIYPKLVGGDVGLSAIWVLLAVVVGGDLMGVVGMFVFIPLVSVIYAYVRSIIYRKLKTKQINVDEKGAPDDVMPLMESRRRLFQRKARELREANLKGENSSYQDEEINDAADDGKDDEETLTEKGRE